MKPLRLVLVVLLAMAFQLEPVLESARWSPVLGPVEAPCDAPDHLTGVQAPSQEQARHEVTGSFQAVLRTALRSRVQFVTTHPTRKVDLRRICAARGDRSPPSEPCSVPSCQEYLRENGSSDAHGERG
jgi:hypothetical protein